MVKDGGKPVRHAQGLEMEQSRMVSLEPDGRNQQAQVTSGRRTDLRETRWGALRQRDGETQKENRREKEKPDRADISGKEE